MLDCLVAPACFECLLKLTCADSHCRSTLQLGSSADALAPSELGRSEFLNSSQVLCQLYFGWICASTSHHHPEERNLAVVCGDQLATILPVHHRDEAVKRGGVLGVLVNILLQVLFIQVFRVESCADWFFKIHGKRFLVILPVPWSSHYVEVLQLCLSWFH